MSFDKTTGTVNTDLLNLRSSPGGSVIGTLPNGTMLLIIDQLGQWFEVKVENQSGYVSSKYVTIEDENPPVDPRIGTVVASRLNFRQNPDGTVISVFEEGTRVNVLEEDGDWYKVEVDGVVGYVNTTYILLAPGTASDQSNRTGKVQVNRLNLRSSPAGPILSVLKKGSEVRILGSQEGWFHIEVEGRTGFVSSQYIGELRSHHSQILFPSNDRGEEFSFEGNRVYGPDGEHFANKYKKGVYQRGETNIRQFLERNPKRFKDLTDSVKSVLSAVSENEGRLEAINTWDTAFLSFGIFQWTVGVKSEAGELPALLKKIQLLYPETYEELFGSYRLATNQITSATGVPPRGYFSLNGRPLVDHLQKSSLRTLHWAYRFWKAGHNDDVREVQIRQAVDRINLFYKVENRKIGKFFIQDYISSQYGVALLLDQHVNRPGHVPMTLAQAVQKLQEKLPVDQPESWSDQEEQLLITTYLELREKTSMTHSNKRAESTHKQVQKNNLSEERGSFLLG